jgi:hypothetical protein
VPCLPAADPKDISGGMKLKIIDLKDWQEIPTNSRKKE